MEFNTSVLQQGLLEDEGAKQKMRTLIYVCCKNAQLMKNRVKQNTKLSFSNMSYFTINSAQK